MVKYGHTLVRNRKPLKAGENVSVRGIEGRVMIGGMPPVDPKSTGSVRVCFGKWPLEVPPEVIGAKWVPTH